MAKTRTITATHDGVTFKRQTHRNYSHVIIGLPDAEAVLRAYRESAEQDIRRSWSYYTKIVDGTYQYMEYVTEDSKAEAAKLVSLGLDGAIKLRMERSEELAKKRIARGWESLAWAGRPDLAAKQVDEWKKPIHCLGQVLAIPVDA